MPKINAENGKWLHLVGVYDGIEMKLYVNGEKVASTLKIAESLKTPASNAWDYTIGAATSSVGAERFAKCSIASANIYSYALSDAQIAEIYDAFK